MQRSFRRLKGVIGPNEREMLSQRRKKTNHIKSDPTSKPAKRNPNSDTGRGSAVWAEPSDVRDLAKRAFTHLNGFIDSRR